MDYHDFELKLRPLGGKEYQIDVRSPSGEKVANVLFPFDELALESRLQALEIALLKSSGTRRDIRFKEEESVEDFGKALFDMMLGGEVRDLYRRSRERARDEGRGLRLRLRVEAPELASLPWEYMYDEGEGDFVCLSAETPVIRYMALAQPPPPLTIEPPIRVLGMVASPNDRAQLDVKREMERIDRATAGLRQEGRLHWEWLPGGGWRDLQRAMREGPWHVFHFVGHGGFDPASQEGILAMEGENGESFRISATQLGRLLADHHTLRLAVLNSCEGAKGSDTNIFSSTASVLMRRGVPAVVAMQYEITDRAAIEFSQVFYEDIARGLAVDTAVTEARKAISMSLGKSLEWGTPVLYMRAPDGVLFNIEGEPAPPVGTESPSEPVSRMGPPPSAPPTRSVSADSDGEGKGSSKSRPLLLGMAGGLAVFIGLVWLVMILADEEDWDVDGTVTASESQSPEQTLPVELSAGFWPDPHRTRVFAGGSEDNAAYFREGLWPECAFGYAQDAPSVILSYRGNDNGYLSIAAMGEGDLTLHVLLPDENWVCDDDSFGDLDPLVAIPWAPSGEYLVWVGTISGDRVPAELLVSEIDLMEYLDRTPGP